MVPALLSPCHRPLPQQPQTHQGNLPFTPCQAVLPQTFKSGHYQPGAQLLVTGPQLLSPYLINAQTQLFSQYLHKPFPLWGPPSSSWSPGHKALVSLNRVSQVTSQPLVCVGRTGKRGKIALRPPCWSWAPGESLSVQSHPFCVRNAHAWISCLSGSVSLRTERGMGERAACPRGILQHTLATGRAANGQGWLCSNLQLPAPLFTRGVFLNLDPSPAGCCCSYFSDGETEAGNVSLDRQPVRG